MPYSNIIIKNMIWETCEISVVVMIVVEYLTMAWDLEMTKLKLENKRIAIRKVRHYLSLSLFS